MTQYSYTALDLVKKINYNGAKEVSYQYNKVGELVQMDDWTGTNTFELDLLGRLQKMTDHKGNTVSYTYDAVGNQTGITYPDGSKTRSFYDAVYNLTSVIDADDGTYAYVYDDANRPVKLTYPNGWIEQYKVIILTKREEILSAIRLYCEKNMTYKLFAMSLDCCMPINHKAIRFFRKTSKLFWIKSCLLRNDALILMRT